MAYGLFTLTAYPHRRVRIPIPISIRIAVLNGHCCIRWSMNSSHYTESDSDSNPNCQLQESESKSRIRIEIHDPDPWSKKTITETLLLRTVRTEFNPFLTETSEWVP